MPLIQAHRLLSCQPSKCSPKVIHSQLWHFAQLLATNLPHPIKQCMQQNVVLAEARVDTGATTTQTIVVITVVALVVVGMVSAAQRARWKHQWSLVVKNGDARSLASTSPSP